MNYELILKFSSIFEFVPSDTGIDSVDENISEICEDEFDSIEYSLVGNIKKAILAKFDLFYEDLQERFSVNDSLGVLDIDISDRRDQGITTYTVIEEEVDFQFSLTSNEEVNKEDLLLFLKEDMKLLKIKEVSEDWIDVIYNQKDVDDFDEVQILIDSYASIENIEILEPEEYYR